MNCLLPRIGAWVSALLLCAAAAVAPALAGTPPTNVGDTCRLVPSDDSPQCTAAEASARGDDVSAVPDRGARKCPCPLRDEGEGEGEGEPEAAHERENDSTAGRIVRQFVPLCAAAMVALISVGLIRGKSRNRLLMVALSIFAALAVGNYTDFGRWRNGRYVNGWEFFHYYLGSKYLPELGHTGLYEAALVADVETGRQFTHKKDAIRNLSTGGCISVDRVLARSDEIKSRFDPDRWDRFRGDIRYFKSTLSPAQWNGVFRDKGYNATPVWSMFVGPLSGSIDTSQPLGMLALSLLDPILMICAVVAVWRTFDLRVALLMIVLVGTHMIMSHSHMKGALLRTDWIAALVLAVCALKAQRPALGGALAAYAATTRVFPVIFAIGLIAQPFVAPALGQPQRRSQWRFVTSFCVTLGLLCAASLCVVGPGVWQEFAVKIWQHNDSFSPWRVGFKHLFVGAYEYRAGDGPSHQQVFHDRWLLWWTIQALVMGGFVYIVRRLENWEILTLGFVPTFFLVAPTYYYYIMLVVPLLFLASRMRRPECAAGLAALLLSSNVAYAIYDRIGRELQLFYALSGMILLVCALISISTLLQTAGWRIELKRASNQPVGASAK